MANARPVRLDLVMATWCPHCDPLSVELAEQLARHLGIPLRILDIDDRDQERLADALVERFGDWTPDYLIPQVFLEREGGTFEHLLTGVPGPTSGTRRAWERVLAAHGAGAAPA